MIGAAAFFMAFVFFILTVIPGVVFSILGFISLRKRVSKSYYSLYIWLAGFIPVTVLLIISIIRLSTNFSEGAPNAEEYEIMFKTFNRAASIPGLSAASGGLVQLVASPFIRKKRD